MDNYENRTPENKPEPESRPEQKEPKGAPKVEPQRVYYRPGQQQQQNDRNQTPGYVPQGAYPAEGRRAGMPTWLKVLIILAIVTVLVVYMLSSCISNIGDALNAAIDNSLTEGGSEVTVGDAQGEYIGVLHIEDTISEDAASLGYDHAYILRSIKAMIEDDNNKGIVLYLNTPGGSVFASDELYLAIKNYQDKTGRPVYASMQSMAASGGYYISAPCSKIFANRNCWTGSIGVTMGEMFDLSELLDRLGVKVETITSGRNKAMGSSYSEMTDEQREIFQGLIDEAYDQFTGIVAEGRGMDIKRVRELADGRIYTALQAKENGLIDEIGTYEECLDAMKNDNMLDPDIQVLDFWPSESVGLSDYLSFFEAGQDGTSGSLTADQIKELAELNGSFKPMYIYGK